MNLSDKNFSGGYETTLYLPEFGRAPVKAHIASYETKTKLYDVIRLADGSFLYHVNMQPGEYHWIHSQIRKRYFKEEV